MINHRNIYPHNEHAALPISPLAEQVPLSLLAEEVFLAEEATSDPRYPENEIRLHFQRGCAHLEMSLHPETMDEQAKIYRTAAESYFSDIYDSPETAPGTVMEAGRLLAQLPFFEMRREKEEFTKTDLEDYAIDLLDMGEDLAATLPEERWATVNSHLIISNLLLRKGIFLYAGTWRESRWDISKSTLSPKEQTTWHTSYAIHNGIKKLPARSLVKKKIGAGLSNGVNYYLEDLIAQTNESVVMPLIDEEQPLSITSRRILQMLRVDSENEASDDTVAFLDTMGEYVASQLQTVAERHQPKETV